MTQSRTFKAAMLGSGQLASKITLLLIAAILSRLFTRVEYATFRQTILVYSFVAPVLALGLPQALYYFIPRDKKHGRGMLTGNLLILFGMGVLFALFTWGGGNKLLASAFDNPSLSRLLLIYSPYAMLALPVMSISACLVSYDRVKALTIYNVFNKIVLLGCVIWFVLIWRTPGSAIYGTVTAAFLVFLPAIFLMYKSTAQGSWLPSLENIRSQIKYSVPLGISIMIGIIAINLDKVIVSSMCPPTQFAVYVNGAFEVPLISIITGSVMAILLPEFTSLHQDSKYEKIIYLWHGAMKRCAVIIFPIMIFLLATTPEVMRIIFSDKYVESSVPFRIYLLLLPIRITQFGAILMAAGRSKLILIRSLVGVLINLVLSVTLVKFIGYLGAAIGTVISIYFWSIPFNLKCIKDILGEKLERFFPYADLCKILFCSFIAIIPVLFLDRFAGLADIILLPVEMLIYGVLVLVLLQAYGYIDIAQLFKRDIGKMFGGGKESFSENGDVNE